MRVVLLTLGLLHNGAALDNGLALTPPMGWLSWERFGCVIDCETYPNDCISQDLYLSQAEELVRGGYRDAGYRYVDIDDCWSEKERENGRIVADKERFPNGLKWLGDRLHKMDLLFGLYGDIGTLTCAGYPGYLDNFDIDAQTLADYGVDSIKVDGCYGDTNDYGQLYPAFAEALNKTGRPILYSCSWPAYLEPKHGEDPDVLNNGIKQNCNTWRNYADIYDTWSSSVKPIIKWWERTGPDDIMVRAAGPGHFNDPDMLLVGNPGLSISEQQAQFAMWAIFAAPLYISSDLRIISEESRQILLNREIIAVNQDPMGRQGWCAESGTYIQIWVRELLPSSGIPCSAGQSDQWAVVLLNLRDIFTVEKIMFDPTKHLPSGDGWGSFSAQDLIKGGTVDINGTLSDIVDESSAAMFKIVRKGVIQSLEA